MNPTGQVKNSPHEKKSERESYREPTLEKREKLVEVAEGLYTTDPVST